MTDQHVTLARHRWRLADGTRIEIYSNNGVNRIVIDVRDADGQQQKKALPIYEFAAQNPFPASKTIKWFRLFFEGGKEAPWRVKANVDYQAQVLPSDKQDSADGIVCSAVGQIEHCGATKRDHIVWHGPLLLPSETPVFAVQGAGDMVHVDYHANRYCNYQVETGIDQFYWYGTTGRGGLAAQNQGATTPIAEGRRFVWLADERYIPVIVAVAPTGLVTVTRLDNGKTGSFEPDLPEWVKANELGQGFAFGAWKLNASCTRAVSVLHGNPWVFEAYRPTFDIGRLLSDPDPAIGGAFQSAVFELEILISASLEGEPIVFVKAHQVRPIEYVQTCGLAYGFPEQHSSGGYWYAADYDTNDDLLTARIQYERRQTFDVRYESQAPPPETPYANIAEVTISSEPTDDDEIDPCGSGNIWGTTKKYSGISWWANDYRFVRTTTTHVDIRLQCTGMDDFILESASSIDELSCVWGATGGGYVWLWSNGSAGSYDVAGYVTAVAQNVYAPCGTWHVRSSAFNGPTSMGASGWRHQYERTVHREPTLKRTLQGLDLRAKTIFYTETETAWSKDGEGGGQLRSGVGWQEWTGCYHEPGYTLTERAGVISPVLGAVKTLKTEQAPAPAPYCDNWAEFYSADYSDADLYPLITKLWHHMILGKLNPKTPKSDGSFIGPFVDWHRYYPYQMIALSADSINWHPAGWVGLRFAQADIDVIHWTDVRGAEHRMSHQEVITLALDVEAKKEEPQLTQAEADRLASAALTTRGEWLALGPIKQWGG